MLDAFTSDRNQAKKYFQLAAALGDDSVEEYLEELNKGEHDLTKK
jgi:uncharacterized protein YpbB